MDVADVDTHASAISFGDVLLDIDNFELTRAGEVVAVEPQVFDVLSYLVTHRDRVVPKPELLDNIWGDRFVSESALTSRIKSARRAVGDDGRRQEIIRTTHGRGYRFVAEVRVVSADHEPVSSNEQTDEHEVEATMQSGAVPAPTRAFVARVRELEVLIDLLADNRLVTVVGPGGVGKTRLATELAQRWDHDSDDPVTFVSLANVSGINGVFVAIRDALGIATGDARGAFGAVLEALDGTPALLVIDNFEHLLDAATTLNNLVEALPDVRLLVTSRERLGLAGEQVLSLEPLGVQPNATTDDPAPAVAFFEHSIRAVRPDVQLDDAAREDIAAICLALDGLPLAIELAAAQTRYFSLSYLRSHLESHAITVADNARDRPERHQTMGSTIDWSYRLLTPRQQQLLAALSVFRNSWPFEAVAAFSDADEPGTAAQDLLALVDKSLVQRSDGVLGEPRFSMLRLLNEFSSAQLDASGRRDEASHRHATFVCETVQSLEARRWSRDDGGKWIDDMNAEYPDAVDALTWSFGGGDPQIGCQIVRALGYWWYRSGRHGEGRVWVDHALANTSATDDSTTAWIHSAAGKLAIYELHSDEAHAHINEALSLARATGDERLEALSQCDLAEAAGGAPDEHDAGLAAVQTGLKLARRLENPALIAHGLTVLGELSRANGQPEEAEAAYGEALDLSAQIGDRYREAVNVLNMGHALMAQDRLVEALSYHRRGIELSSRIGSRIQMAWNLSELATGHHRLGDPQLAAQLDGTAQAALSRLGTTLGPVDQPIYERNQQALRSDLGDDDYERLASQGRGLSLHDGIEMALNALDERAPIEQR